MNVVPLYLGYLLDKPIKEDEPKIEQIIKVLKEVYAFKDESNCRATVTTTFTLRGTLWEELLLSYVLLF